MRDELVPVDELVIDLFQRSRVVVGELDAFPLAFGRMCTFGRFHIEVDDSLAFAHCGVARVGKWTRLSIAQASEVVFVSTERRVRFRLDLVRAKLVTDDRPDHIV